MASDPMTRDSVLNAEESTSRSAATAPPCLSGDQMTVFGDGLLAITQELQERPEAEASSLSQWLTWLDDEGYDQASFCAALQHLCEQRLSAEAFQQLLAQASARAEAPQGLPEAIKHLSGQHPELLDEIQELEQRRQSELERILATAGGMKKSTEIEIGVGTFYGLGFVTGSVGLGRAYFRKKASDRMAAGARDRMKKEVVNHSNIVTDDWSIKECHRIKRSADTIYRLEYKMPLVNQEAHEIITYSNICTNIIKNAHMNASTDPFEHSRIASEIETRLMACMQPEVYLRKMKEWAVLEMKIDGDIHEIKKIADFDIQLRREFEASKFADDFILKLCKSKDEYKKVYATATDIERKDLKPAHLTDEGVIKLWRDFGSQDFFGEMADQFKDKLIRTRQTLFDEFKNNKKKLASEVVRADKENAFFELDLSDASVRSLITDGMAEAGLRAAARGNIGKFIDVKKLLFNDFKDSFLTDVIEPYLTKIKELEESTLDAEVQRLHIGEFERNSENKVFKKLETELRLYGGPAAEKFALHRWEIERDKIIKSFNDAVDDQAKKEAEKQLAALDDFQYWVDNKLKNEISLLQDFLEADAAKDIKKAYDAVLAAEEKALEAERDIPK